MASKTELTTVLSQRDRGAFLSENLSSLPPKWNGLFYLALAVFAQEQGIGPNKHLALVMDQAGWHKSTALRVPQGLHLLFLPSHSPELQPAERL